MERVMITVRVWCAQPLMNRNEDNNPNLVETMQARVIAVP